MVFPCNAPPRATGPVAPVGPPGFRRRPSVRDAVLDLGGASPSRLATAHMQPSTSITVSASTTSLISRLTFRIPHDPCLRFGPRVAATPARLGSGAARYGPRRTGLTPVSHRQLFPAHYGPSPRARVEVQTRCGTRLQSYIRPAGSDETPGLDGFPRVFIALPFCWPQRALEIHRFGRRRS